MVKANNAMQYAQRQMKQNLQKIYKALTEEITAMAISILENDAISNNAKANKNTLRDSALRYGISTKYEIGRNGNAIISVLFENYLQYIEKGRKPKCGKRPPIHALKAWAEKKGLPTDNETLWAISSAIWRDGYEGRPIFAELEKLIEEKWQKEWTEGIMNYEFEFTRIDEVKQRSAKLIVNRRSKL